MASDNVNAVFIDVMGFASAIAALSHDEHRFMTEALRHRYYARHSPKVARIVANYDVFHSELHSRITAEIPDRKVDTMVVFSDSALIV